MKWTSIGKIRINNSDNINSSFKRLQTSMKINIISLCAKCTCIAVFFIQRISTQLLRWIERCIYITLCSTITRKTVAMVTTSRKWNRLSQSCNLRRFFFSAHDLNLLFPYFCQFQVSNDKYDKKIISWTSTPLHPNI